MNLFFPVGLPANHEVIRAGLNLEPRLMSVAPNVMYNAGGLLTAVIPGIGVNDTSKIDLVSNTGVSLC